MTRGHAKSVHVTFECHITITQFAIVYDTVSGCKVAEAGGLQGLSVSD
jgi:hypothetical protein